MNPETAVEVVASFQSNNQSSSNLEQFENAFHCVSLFGDKQLLQQVYIDNEQEAVVEYLNM